MNSNSSYKMLITYDKSTQGYYGSFPDIEGVVIWAKTRTEAQKELEIVLRNIKEYWQEYGITPVKEQKQ